MCMGGGGGGYSSPSAAANQSQIDRTNLSEDDFQKKYGQRRDGTLLTQDGEISTPDGKTQSLLG